MNMRTVYIFRCLFAISQVYGIKILLLLIFLWCHSFNARVVRWQIALADIDKRINNKPLFASAIVALQ